MSWGRGSEVDLANMVRWKDKKVEGKGGVVRGEFFQR